MRAKDFFQVTHLAHGYVHLAFVGAFHGALRDRRIITGSKECIVVVVNVHHLITGKVHRIRKEGPGVAEEFRVEDLQRQRLPSSGRAAAEYARVGLADDAEVFFDVRDQFRHDGIAIGTVVD